MNELIARVAYINAQVACMLAELEAMKAENNKRDNNNLSAAYSEEDFRMLPDRYGIGHNQVIGYLGHGT